MARRRLPLVSDRNHIHPKRWLVLIFDAVVARISSFLTFSSFASMDTSAERCQLCASQTSDHFAVQSLKLPNLIDHPLTPCLCESW
jgi:hypothetical protein